MYSQFSVMGDALVCRTECWKQLLYLGFKGEVNRSGHCFKDTVVLGKSFFKRDSEDVLCSVYADLAIMFMLMFPCWLHLLFFFKIVHFQDSNVNFIYGITFMYIYPLPLYNIYFFPLYIRTFYIYV